MSVLGFCNIILFSSGIENTIFKIAVKTFEHFLLLHTLQSEGCWKPKCAWQSPETFMRTLQASEMLNSHCCQFITSESQAPSIQCQFEHLTQTCELWPSWVDGASLLTLPIPTWMKMSENCHVSSTYMNKDKCEKQQNKKPSCICTKQHG